MEAGGPADRRPVRRHPLGAGGGRGAARPRPSPSTRFCPTRRARAAPRRPRSLRPREEGWARFVIEACEQLPVDLDVVHGVPHEEAVERFKRRHRRRPDALHLARRLRDRVDGVREAGRDVARRDGRPPDGGSVRVRGADRVREADTLVEKPACSPSPSRSGGAAVRPAALYVEQVHDIDKLADRLIAVYESL